MTIVAGGAAGEGEQRERGRERARILLVGGTGCGSEYAGRLTTSRSAPRSGKLPSEADPSITSVWPSSAEGWKRCETYKKKRFPKRERELDTKVGFYRERERERREATGLRNTKDCVAFLDGEKRMQPRAFSPLHE